MQDATHRTVEIRYVRPPDRITVFRQRFVHREGGCVITLMERTPLARPLRVADRTILEPGSAVVWFTFDGLWHDIGRFHIDDEFTGYYANVLTPVRYLTPLRWETTDLFLDVWLGADGSAVLLDEQELTQAERDRVVDEAVAQRARSEAATLLAAAASGEWPPRIVREWTLGRARQGGTRDASGV